MNFKLAIFTAISFIFIRNGFTQNISTDSTTNEIKVPVKYDVLKNEQAYNTGNGKIYIYPKPASFGFLAKAPHDGMKMITTTFSRKSIRPLLLIAASTTALLFADQEIADHSQKMCYKMDIQTAEENKTLVALKLGKKPTTLIKVPQNINTAFYQLGEGFYGLLIGAGLFTYGKIHHNYRALSTASQLTESFILMGVGTQLLKRIAGRETPGEATAPGGKWHLFPSFKKFQDNTPKYDAFPSGHLSTLMATVTILAENYPEKKWIAPVGYSVTGLVGLSMINNGVHWASDFPLAIGLGYLCARQIVKNSRKLLNISPTKKSKKELSYSFNYVNGKMLPGVVYKF